MAKKNFFIIKHLGVFVIINAKNQLLYSSAKLTKVNFSKTNFRLMRIIIDKETYLYHQLNDLDELLVKKRSLFFKIKILYSE
jgi:hypothetical protein